MLTLLQKYLPVSHEAMRQGMVAMGRVVLDEGTNAPEAQHKCSWVLYEWTILLKCIIFQR